MTYNRVTALIKRLPAALGLCLVFTVLGCTTFQSPRVLQKGEQTITLAAAANTGVLEGELGEPWFLFDLAFRTHVVNRFDLGLQLYIPLTSLPSSHLIADVKYQLIQRPPCYLAGGLGLGFGLYNGILAQALLIGGTENLYVGIKPIVNMPWLLFEYWSFYPITIVGLSLGGKVRFLLEANVAPLGLLLDVWPVDVIPLPILSVGAGVVFKF